MELIKLENIKKTYRLGEVSVPVLKGVTATINKGEMVALLGTSGSGKTTLMNLLGCLDRPSSGSYWLDGQRIDTMTADQRALVRNRKIGFVFQESNLLARTSALDNVIMPLSYTAQEMSARESRRRAQNLLRRVGLGNRLDQEPAQLTGGQQQRVAIARSLVNYPPLLLADEPTGALDSRTTEEILDLFQQLNEEEGLTILLVTHDPDVANHARRVIRIQDGLVQEDSSPPVPASTKMEEQPLAAPWGLPLSSVPLDALMASPFHQEIVLSSQFSVVRKGP
jgi:ABC-type lipoprotein export system ATPase subunit